jgi:hypothetical protein
MILWANDRLPFEKRKNMRGQSRPHAGGGYRHAGRKRQSSNNYALHSLSTYSISVAQQASHVRWHCIAPYTDLSGLSHAPMDMLAARLSEDCHTMITPHDHASVHTPQQYGHDRSTE